jgi:hypothetical protein
MNAARKLRAIVLSATIGALVCAIVLMAAALNTARAQNHRTQSRLTAYESAERKFAWIGENGRSAVPNPQPTVLASEEWNAYLNEGGVNLPEGVTAVHIHTRPSVIQGEAEVDFDRLTANRTRSNPLLQLFTGKHHVLVLAHGSAIRGVATIQVDHVTFDGVEIPRFALDYFAQRYLRPHYGSAVGLDSVFRLKNRMYTVVVGDEQATITQR